MGGIRVVFVHEVAHAFIQLFRGTSEHSTGIYKGVTLSISLHKKNIKEINVKLISVACAEQTRENNACFITDSHSTQPIKTQ